MSPYMSPPFQQLLFHFKEYYQCLLSYVRGMCYNMTSDDKILVLLKTTLGVCQVNPEQKMNVMKFDTYICYLKIHNKNITIPD